MFRLAHGLYMMRRCTNSNVVTVGLLYIHSFRPLLAHTFTETERMIQTDPKALTATADKLRYYRHVNGLEQQEVAAYVGLHRGTYAGYENRVSGITTPWTSSLPWQSCSMFPWSIFWTITTLSSTKARGGKSRRSGSAWDFPGENLRTG